MQFTILERFTLFDILPVVGNFVTLKTIRQLREDLTITEDEQKAINFRELEKEPGQFKWDLELEPEPKEIAISDIAKSVIVGRLKELDEKGLLTMQHYSLCERFLDGE